MAFFRRLFGRREAANGATPADSANRQNRDQPPVQVHIEVVEVRGPRIDDQGLVKLTGTTTFGKDAITALAERHGIGDGGYLETVAEIQREPDNEADPMAVAVHVEGERIGYLPGWFAQYLELPAGAARQVQVQIFTELLTDDLRAEAWAWLGQNTPQWEWSQTNRPPLSREAKLAALQGNIDEVITRALASRGTPAEPTKDGFVNGIFYTEFAEPIKKLKREGRLRDALVLCYMAIAGAEMDARYMRREPAPFYTKHAAIVHRKLGERDEEIAVLERWLAACPPDRRAGSGIQKRLDKLTQSH